MKPTRVVFVTNYRSLLPTNPFKNIFTERSFRALKDAGIDVEFFDIGLSHSPVKQFASWRALRRLIRERRPDLLHAQQGTITGFVSVMTFHPTIISYIGADLLPGASIPLWRTWMGIALSNISSLVAKASILMTDEMQRALWWKSKKTFVIPHGVDLELFKPVPRDDARRRLGWNPTRPIVLFMGWRDPGNKGLPLAEATMALVRKALPDAEMVMPRGIPPDDVAMYMQAADVLLFTSRQEGSPNAVKEALACNLPIISVAVGDVKTRLAGVTHSAIIDRNAEKLAAAVVDVLRAPTRSNGRDQVMSLSWRKITEEIIEVYGVALREPIVRAKHATS